MRLGATHGIDEVMETHKLDALLFPGGSGAALAAKPGYPTVIVPFALVAYSPPAPGAPAGGGGPGRQRALPGGLHAEAFPLRRDFTGGACQEPRLIALAYAFEQIDEAPRPAAVSAVRSAAAQGRKHRPSSLTHM